ncbi:ATP-binding cassette domain-containing protein [Streptomyces sp. B1866]|uniref:ATP-binding cassette domain-containing protein n=1 Tax=Streptomyces sp. B1866 TaxID=3075431 RepID=UPI0034D98290
MPRDQFGQQVAGGGSGLVGANGAGKTTTLRMLTTLLPPASRARADHARPRVHRRARRRHAREEPGRITPRAPQCSGAFPGAIAAGQLGQ